MIADPTLELSKSDAAARARFRLIEAYLWTIIATAIAGRVLYFSVRYPSDATGILRDFYWDVVIAGLVFIFPVVFRLIFGLLPLEFLRQSRLRSQRPSSVINIGGDYLGGPLPGTEPTQTGQLNGSPAATVPAHALLLEYARSSRQLAKSIYGRAGVYLLVGVLVAFSGLAFFYAQTGALTATPDIGAFFLVLAPKFGILFFIEFVAFFFLRQYRSAMDEFRYYEAVARVREEVVALFCLASDSGSPLQPLELVKYDSYFSKAGLLSKGQSTEILETRKMEKNEIDLLEKVVDTLARAKKEI
jgi:hypothetical protein